MSFFANRKKKNNSPVNENSVVISRQRSLSEPPKFSPRDSLNEFLTQIEKGTQKKVNVTRHRSGSYTLETDDGLSINVYITN